MNWKEYQINVKRTLANLKSYKEDLAHTILGLMSEYSEYIDAVEANDKVNINEEIGDKCWYLAAYCNLRNIDLEVITMNTQTYTYNLSLLSNLVKRYIAYNKEFDRDLEIELVSKLAANLIRMAGDSRLEDILEKNINKLKVRYPENFNETKAIERNLEAEYKTLI